MIWVILILVVTVVAATVFSKFVYFTPVTVANPATVTTTAPVTVREVKARRQYTSRKNLRRSLGGWSGAAATRKEG